VFEDLINRILGRGSRSTIQARVDEIARADRRERQSREGAPVFGGDWSSVRQEPDADEPAAPLGGLLGSLLRNLTGMQDMGQAIDQMHIARPWLNQLNRISQELPPDARLRAVQEVVAGLPETTLHQLRKRLRSATGDDSTDVAQAIADQLEYPDGVERILGLLVPADSFSGASPSLLAAMKDPLVRDLLRNLPLALVRERGAANSPVF
jgi:hypothetical protein